MSQSYKRVKLFQIGEDNYNTLVNFCNILSEEGYWEKPQSVLNRSIDEMLAIYVQSVLFQLAAYCECFNKEECEFIHEIPTHNILGISLGDNDVTELTYQTERILKAPPILLQLCSLRDLEKASDLAGKFFDALLNILLAMAYINDSKNRKLTSFIMGYFQQINVFIKVNKKFNYIIDDRYVFRKISCEEIEQSYPFLKTFNNNYNNLDKTNTVIVKEDITIQAEVSVEQTEGEKENLKEYLYELQSLIGLESVKEEISSLINLIKVRKLREEYNMPSLNMSYHMVYTGNPGTGKTTVARLVAKIYKELGILSTGNMVETDRSGLVAGFVGQTALKVKEVVERAIGGVLFIDEAYALSNGAGTNDFGTEAIDTLVKLMEDHREDLVVIVAGYKEEMGQFLKANTGLISRFNKFIDFEDYNHDQLILILNSMTEKAGLTINEDSLQAVKDKLLAMREEEKQQFGNARGIRNVFEKIMVNQANRIVCFQKPTKEQLAEITVDDVSHIL